MSLSTADIFQLTDVSNDDEERKGEGGGIWRVSRGTNEAAFFVH